MFELAVLIIALALLPAALAVGFVILYILFWIALAAVAVGLLVWMWVDPVTAGPIVGPFVAVGGLLLLVSLGEMYVKKRKEKKP